MRRVFICLHAALFALALAGAAHYALSIGQDATGFLPFLVLMAVFGSTAHHLWRTA